MKKLRLMRDLWREHHSSTVTIFLKPETSAAGVSIKNGQIRVAEDGHFRYGVMFGGPLLAGAILSMEDTE